MPTSVRVAFEAELRAAHEAGRGGDAERMWPHLERAHILSQDWAWPHTRAHWEMFRLAVRCRDRTEALGQVVRLVVAGPGSLMGRAPKGNTGRTGVGLHTVLPLPADLARILDEASASGL
ncbi:DUF3703 domain-containing protein [Streptomyces reniochalinae]|uniref:DUF3703 domain-containing protein n=1 Tax=Streptomyces reniochalinae TaxID=2250578 RepID=A0A367F3U9_9ACTN|nr:DUF3703 domain-containing protein [Streptomyces reniochalinae]RCG24599.1 DUF3703 domain-containing protein [Streptomyces reniochalinae]